MKEKLKNTVIEFYKSGIQENIDLADAILDSQKHIPMRQLKSIDEAIVKGCAFNSRHSWRYPAARREEILQKSYNRSKTSLKYINNVKNR